MKNNSENKEDKADKEYREETLISKNMTNRDIYEEKEEVINKKLYALSEFVTYKKDNKPKNVLEYYKNEDKNIENENMAVQNIRNIDFIKKK
jgi:hypothetical protein